MVQICHLYFHNSYSPITGTENYIRTQISGVNEIENNSHVGVSHHYFPSLPLHRQYVTSDMFILQPHYKENIL